MARESINWIAWLLGGAAFVSVVALPGCASNSTETVVPGKDGTTVTSDGNTEPAPLTSDQAIASEKLANTKDVMLPAANIFGELPNRPTDTRSGSNEFSFQQHTFIEEGFDSEPSISPDGKWIAYASTRHSDTTDIYLQKVDGLAVTQLTSDAADDEFPTFSPDGQRIAFASNRSGTWDIYAMDRTGKNITQITSGPAHDMHPTFSPDGTRLAYCSLNPRGQWEMWIVNLVSSERKMIGYGLFPKWSPQKDKDVIAFQRARNRGGRLFSLWTAEIIDGEARSITEVTSSPTTAIVSPTWSPDGKRLAFAAVADPTKLDSHGKPMGQQDVWTVNADGTGRHRITDGGGVNSSPFWGVDNRIYFISNRGGSDCVWSVGVGNGEEGPQAAQATTATPER